MSFSHLCSFYEMIKDDLLQFSTMSALSHMYLSTSLQPTLLVRARSGKIGRYLASYLVFVTIDRKHH